MMDHPLFYAAIAGLLIAAAFLIRWVASRRCLMEDARIEYAERCESKPKTVKGVDAETFERLYVAAYEPRWALYVAGALVLAIIITPPAAMGLVALWPILVLGLEAGPWYDEGYYPWMFYMFFGFCGIWALCGFLMARIHHARRPESFNPALARARGEPLDDVVIPRKRPAWAVKARPDPVQPAPTAQSPEPAPAGDKPAKKKKTRGLVLFVCMGSHGLKGAKRSEIPSASLVIGIEDVWFELNAKLDHYCFVTALVDWAGRVKTGQESELRFDQGANLDPDEACLTQVWDGPVELRVVPLPGDHVRLQILDGETPVAGAEIEMDRSAFISRVNEHLFADRMNRSLLEDIAEQMGTPWPDQAIDALK